MEGIVINTIDYKEKSKIVYLYTPNGISSVKALDVMKKNLGFTVTLNHVEYSVTNGKFPTILEYSLKKSYFDLCTNLSKINIVTIIIDVIKKLEGEYPHSRIFSFFKECLDLLEKSKEPKFVLSLFLIKMLYIFGVKPAFDECVLCGDKTLVNWSIHSGGALCNKCSTYNETSMKYLSWFKKIYNAKDYNEDLYTDIDYNELIKEINSYYSLHVNMKLKQII